MLRPQGREWVWRERGEGEVGTEAVGPRVVWARLAWPLQPGLPSCNGCGQQVSKRGMP